MYELKTELLEICDAFNLGTFRSSKTIEKSFLGLYIKTEFKTDKGTYTHFFKIKN